jgi:glucuronate isomerase
MTALTLHPDRLLPADPEQRRLARAIFAEIEHLPIVSPHGHLDVALFVEDEPFADPAHLFITSDHYVVRLLHAQGVPVGDLGLVPRSGGERASGREVWRQLCTHWGALAGTPSRLWLEHELYELCDLRTVPSADSADESYDALTARLQEDDLRPRALYERFGLDVLTTTDPATADLAMHAALRNDPTWKGRLLPNFRPDGVLDPAHPQFIENLARLAEVSGSDTSSYRGYIAALEDRRRFFQRNGATAADHGVPLTTTERLSGSEAEAVYERARTGRATGAEVEAFRGHMLDEMARMSAEDGMVMQLHIGVARDYDALYAATYGPDIGQDFPHAVDFTRTLRPLVSRYGNSDGFRMVLYTIDETTYSREIGPLVSYFPGLFAGPPWWFLDSPDAMTRAFVALGETAGITKLTGFVDDTRSLFGIGARHDVARRVCAGYLARLVAEHRLPLDEATKLAVGYAYERPKELFKV